MTETGNMNDKLTLVKLNTAAALIAAGAVAAVRRAWRALILKPT